MDKKIKDGFKKYLVGKRSLSPKTADVYLGRLTVFLKHVGLEYEPEKVTEDIVVGHLAELKVDYKMAPNTRRLVKVSIETFYRWFSGVAGIPDPSGDLAPIKQYYMDPRFLNPDDVEIFLRAMDEHRDRDFARRNCAILALLADTGIRIGEFEALKTGDVQPVYKNRDIVNFELHVSAMKGSHARVVPFSRLVDGDLCAEFFSRYFLWLTMEKQQPKDKPLFFRLKSGLYEENTRAALLRGGIKNLLFLARKLAGVDKLVSPHDFRHYYGTYSYVNGIDLRTLQVFMGHAHLQTTMRYIHVGERIKGTALKHTATVGLKAPVGVTGYAELMKKLGKK